MLSAPGLPISLKIMQQGLYTNSRDVEGWKMSRACTGEVEYCLLDQSQDLLSSNVV